VPVGPLTPVATRAPVVRQSLAKRKRGVPGGNSDAALPAHRSPTTTAARAGG